MRNIIVIGMAMSLGCSFAHADGVTDLVAAVVYVNRHCPDLTVNKDALAGRLHELGISDSTQVNEEAMKDKIISTLHAYEDALTPTAGCDKFLLEYEDKVQWRSVFKRE